MSWACLIIALPRVLASPCATSSPEITLFHIGGTTVQQMKWLVTLFLSPVAAVAFSVAICGVLVVSLTAELHQQLWPSK